MRLRTVLSACLGVLLAGPAAAHAGTISVSGSTLTYRGGSAANDLTLVAVGEAYRVSDASGVSAGAGCASLGRTEATCAGGAVRAVTVTGEGGNDVLRALTVIPPTVNGGAGNDEIRVGDAGSRMSGQSGDDVLIGGAGPDSASGGDGSDRIEGHGGPDRLNGDRGNDVVDGGDENDVLRGGDGNDVVRGGNEADRVEGGAGDDVLDGGLGPDVFRGGRGRDTADYSARTAPVIVDLDGNPDDGEVDEGDNVTNDVERVAGGSGDDRLTAITGPRTLVGNGGDDVLEGGRGADTLEGGPGDDTLSGDLSADLLDGGEGTDTADYSRRFNAVRVDLTRGTTTINRGNPSSPRRTTERDTLRSIENAIGSSRGDVLLGDAGPNVLEGGSGNDVLSGGASADVLSGGAGRDTVTYRSRRTGVRVTLDDVANDGAPGEGDDVRSTVEEVLGGRGNDVLVGSARPNALHGGPGRDRLLGGEGRDRLVGGPGRDQVDAGPGRDVLSLRDGEVDRARCSGPEDRVSADPRDRLTGCRR